MNYLSNEFAVAELMDKTELPVPASLVWQLEDHIKAFRREYYPTAIPFAMCIDFVFNWLEHYFIDRCIYAFRFDELFQTDEHYRDVCMEEFREAAYESNPLYNNLYDTTVFALAEAGYTAFDLEGCYAHKVINPTQGAFHIKVIEPRYAEW